MGLPLTNESAIGAINDDSLVEDWISPPRTLKISGVDTTWLVRVVGRWKALLPIREVTMIGAGSTLMLGKDRVVGCEVGGIDHQ